MHALRRLDDLSFFFSRKRNSQYFMWSGHRKMCLFLADKLDSQLVKLKIYHLKDKRLQYNSQLFCEY